MKDIVRVDDYLYLNHRETGSLKGLWDAGKEPVEIKGFFSLMCRERGKYVPGTKREGFNTFPDEPGWLTRAMRYLRKDEVIL